MVLEDQTPIGDESILNVQELNARCYGILNNSIMLEYLRYAPSATALSEHLERNGWSRETCAKARAAKIMYDLLGIEGFMPWTKTSHRPIENQFAMHTAKTDQIIGGLCPHQMSSKSFRFGEDEDDRSDWPWLLREQFLRQDNGESISTFDGYGAESTYFVEIDSDFNQLTDLYRPGFSTISMSDDNRFKICTWAGSGRLHISVPRTNTRRGSQIDSETVVMKPTGDKKFPEYYKRVTMKETDYSSGSFDHVTIFLRLDLNYSNENRRHNRPLFAGKVLFRRVYRFSSKFEKTLSLEYNVHPGEFVMTLAEPTIPPLLTDFNSSNSDLRYSQLREGNGSMLSPNEYAKVCKEAWSDYMRLIDTGLSRLDLIAGSKVVTDPQNRLMDLLLLPV